ncbi:ABC transporter ATP-binding protein [Streptomyces marincola]|uniref:ABC transporter ATP-binding protein n=1 Tax=Streptomyces marincola TaxID=2878388 RepID=UPI001CF44525|nr:ABC transporter ATP-binding protein [Streptomyces marincola]UCM88236.1 ABC transporter ATP-binding protein [Streptomyces marincola]
MAAIELAGLRKTYPGGVTALDSVELSIADGEFFALLGPSGCGKTTLLRTLAGLEAADGGAVRIGGEDVTALPPGRRDVAMVFQDYALFPHMTVSDNIAYPLRIKKVGGAQRRAKAAETAGALGLGALLDRRPGELSGGQQQRVALARAMAVRPRAFLLDEPLSNLDARLRLEARTFLKRLQRELRVTCVFVTHDQAEALALADRIAVLDAGRVRQTGTPVEVFRRPANTFVASFIGSTPMNLLDGVVAEDGRVLVGGVPLPAGPHGLAAGERVTFAVRPEYVGLRGTPAPGALPGRVTVVEHLGSTRLVTLDGDAGPVRAVVDEDAPLPAGGTGWVVPRPERVLLYDADGELVAAPPEAGESAPWAR